MINDESSQNVTVTDHCTSVIHFMYRQRSLSVICPCDILQRIIKRELVKNGKSTEKNLKVVTVGVKFEFNVNGFIEAITDHGNVAPFKRQMQSE